MTHSDDVVETPSSTPIAGSATLTMLKPRMTTSDAPSTTLRPRRPRGSDPADRSSREFRAVAALTGSLSPVRGLGSSRERVVGRQAVSRHEASDFAVYGFAGAGAGPLP